MSNRGVDGLLDRMASELDEGAAAELADAADRLLWDELVTLPLYQVPILSAWADGLTGVAPNPTSAGLLWNSDSFTLTR